MMDGSGRSDSAVVARKSSNKTGKQVAERMEPKAEAEGSEGQQRICRAQKRISLYHALERVRQAARTRKKEQFTSLLHLVSIDLLRLTYFDLKRKAAPDVERLSWSDCGAGPEEYLASLDERVHREAYRALP